jgi:hypothetical protein
MSRSMSVIARGARHAGTRRLGIDIGLLQVNAPIPQRLQWDFSPRHSTHNEVPGAEDLEIAIQIANAGLTGLRRILGQHGVLYA